MLIESFMDVKNTVFRRDEGGPDWLTIDMMELVDMLLNDQ